MMGITAQALVCVSSCLLYADERYLLAACLRQ